MRDVYVVVCDSGRWDNASTEVVCIASTERSAERVCADANEILSEGWCVRDDIDSAHFSNAEDVDHDAYKRRLSDALRPFRERLLAVVGDRFDPEFDGEERMRFEVTSYCPRYKRPARTKASARSTRTVDHGLLCRACGATWAEGEKPGPCTHPARRGSHETYMRRSGAEGGE